MSCNNGGSTTGSNTSCSSQAEASTNDSGRSSSSKESSCSSERSSRESSSADTLNRGRCLIDNAAYSGSARGPAGRDQQQVNKLQDQNQQQQGKPQQQQIKHQKTQQKQDQQQRRQQHRKQQQQPVKEDRDVSAGSAWPSLSAGLSRVWGERKQLGVKRGGSGEADGGATASAACEASRIHKDGYLTTGRNAAAAGSKDFACREAADIVPESGSAGAAATQETTAPAHISGAEAGTSTTRGAAAGKGAGTSVAAGSDGTVATGAAVAAAKTASVNAAHASVAVTAARLPQTAIAAAARPPALAAGKRTTGRMTAPAPPKATAAAAGVPSAAGVAGKTGVCVPGSAAVEPKKGRPPRRAPWCKSALSTGKQKQHNDQQQHERHECGQERQFDEQQANSCQRLQQHQQDGQATAKELHLESPASAWGELLAPEKEVETDDAAGNASVQTAVPDSAPLSPPAEATPAARTASVGQGAIKSPPPTSAAEDVHGAQMETEASGRQQQETRVGKVGAQAGDGVPQLRQEKMVAATPFQQARPAAASDAADVSEGLRAQWVLQQGTAEKDKSEGELSSVIAQWPSGLSSEERAAASADIPTTAKAAAAGESPFTAENGRPRRSAAKTSTLCVSLEETAGEAADSKAADARHRRLQQQEAETQRQGSALHSPAATLPYAKGKDAVAFLSTSVNSEVAAPSTDPTAVAAPHATCAGDGDSTAAAGDTAARRLPEGAADTTTLSVRSAAVPAASYASPRTPTADGRRTFAAAAAAALQRSAESQKGSDVMPRQQLLQNSQQHQQLQQVQKLDEAKASDPPACGRDEWSHHTKTPVVARADHLSAASAAESPPSPPPVLAAPAVVAAVRAGAAASGVPSALASATAVPLRATVAPAAVPSATVARAAVAAVGGGATTPCNKETAENATGSVAQQQRRPRAAATGTEEGERVQRQLVMQHSSEDNEEQPQPKQQQDKQKKEHERRDEEQHTEQQRRRWQPVSYSRPLPRAAEQPQQLVTMMQQRRCAQQHRQRGASEGDGIETAAHDGAEEEDDNGEQQERSPSVDKREATGTDEGLSIPLTSTILADRRSVFYKTQLCPHAVRGRCRLDEQCNFAHSRRELRPPPRLDKTKICASIKAGVVCPNGERCLFAHNREELRHSVAFYKTNMCRSWISGACMHPHTCNHAHGMRELFFFRTLAAVAGCRDFRRERHGVAAAGAAASTPSKAASVAAALDSLRRRLAAATPTAATPPTSVALRTGAAGGNGAGDCDTRTGGRGDEGGEWSPAAAATRAAAVAASEMRGSASAAAYGGGVAPDEREGRGGQDTHVPLKGAVERQRPGTFKADAGAKGNSSSSSDSTRTLDSSGSTNGGGSSSSRDSLHMGSSSGNVHSFGMNNTTTEPEPLIRNNSGVSGSGGGHKQNNNTVLQQRLKHANNRAGDRQRPTQGGSATHRRESTSRRVEQQQPTNISEQDGDLDDLVALIPLLPDNEREFAELLLAYIEASAADKDNAASLVLSIPPEFTVEAMARGHGRGAATAAAAAEPHIRGEAAAGDHDVATVVAAEGREQNDVAGGRWRTAAAVENCAATIESGGRAGCFNRRESAAGNGGEKCGLGRSGAGASGVTEALDGMDSAQETTNKGSRGRVATAGKGSRETAAARCGSEAASRTAAHWNSRRGAGRREASPRGNDIPATLRTRSERLHLTEPCVQGTSAFSLGFEGSQQQQQLTHTSAPRTARAAAAAEFDISTTRGKTTDAEPHAQTQQRLYAHQIPKQQLQQQQKQQQQQVRDSSTVGGSKLDVPVKARQSGKRCGRKGGLNVTPADDFPLRREQQQLLHSWGTYADSAAVLQAYCRSSNLTICKTQPRSVDAPDHVGSAQTLEHYKKVASVQQGHRGEVDGLKNLVANSAEGRTASVAAGAGEQQTQQQREQAQSGERHVQKQGQQMVFRRQEKAAAACKKRNHQSWAAATAANAGDEGKERAGMSCLVAGSGVAVHPVADRRGADTVGEVRHPKKVLSHFVHSHLSQGLHEQRRKHRVSRRQQQQPQRATSREHQQKELQQRQPTWTQKEKQCAQQQRAQQQQQKSAPAQVEWLCSTRRATARRRGSEAASGKGTAPDGETLLLTEETRKRERGIAGPGAFHQELSLETLAVCCSSGVTNFAVPATSSCSVAPPSTEGVYQEKLAQHAQQLSVAQQVWQQREPRLEQLQPHRRPLPPLCLQSAAAPMLLNRDVASATGRKQPEQQLPLQEGHRQQPPQRGIGWQQQHRERLNEKHSEQHGIVQWQQEGNLGRAAAGTSSSHPSLWDQAKGASRRQQPQQQLPRPVGPSGCAFSEAGRKGGKTRGGAPQLQKASQTVTVPRWQHQCTGPPLHTPADAGVDPGLRLQQQQEHDFVRGHLWKHQSEQQQEQQNGDEQHQQAKKTGEEQQQQEHCVDSFPFNLSNYPLLWRLGPGTADIVSPAEVKKQLQQQQRERDICAAVRACWDNNERDKTALQPSPWLRVQPPGTAARSPLPSPTLLPPAGSGTVLHSTTAEALPELFLFPSPCSPPSTATPLGVPSANAVGSGRAAAAAPVAPESVQVDALAAAVLAAAAAETGGNHAAGGTAVPEAVHAAGAAGALIKMGLVESPLSAAPRGPHGGGGCNGARITAAERPLPQHFALPQTFETGGQQTCAADTDAAEPLACSLVPLHDEQRAIREQAGPPQSLQLFLPQQLRKEDGNRREEGGQAAAAEHLEDAWIYSGNSGDNPSRQSVCSGRRSSNMVAVDSETSVTLLQQLLVQHQAAPGSSSSSRPVGNAGSPHNSSAEGALSTALAAAAAAPSAAAAVSVPATARQIPAETPPVAGAGLHVASPGANICPVWEEGDTAKTTASQQPPKADGAQGIEQHLPQPGSSSGWSATNSTPACRRRRCSGGGAGGSNAGSSDQNAEFTASTAGEEAARANIATASDAAGGAAAGGAAAGQAPATGNRAAAAASTSRSTGPRKTTAGEQACSEQSGIWRRRAKSSAAAGTPAATPAGRSGPSLTVGGRRRATTADVEGGGSAALVEAAKRPLQTASSVPRRTAVGERDKNCCDCPATETAHTSSGDGISTTAGATSGEAEPSAQGGTAKPKQGPTSTIRAADTAGVTGQPAHSVVPKSPLYICSNFTYASHSSFPSSSAPAGGVLADREMVAQRLPLANHDDELPPVGGGATAITGASPAWSYSASTAAASDDSMDCRLILLPKSCTLLDRVPTEERESAARSSTEVKRQHQESKEVGRVTNGLVSGADAKGRAQQQLLCTQQQQREHQGGQLPQQYRQQQQQPPQEQQQSQQPQEQPQQQQANHFLFSELLTTEPGAAGSAHGSASHTETMLIENVNLSVLQQQQHQSTASPLLTGSQSASRRNSVRKASSNSCLYSDNSGAKVEMTTRYANTYIRSSSGTITCSDDQVQQLHQKGNYVDYTFSCDRQLSSDTFRRTLNSSCNSGNSASLYSISSHSLSLSSGSSKCGSNNSSHGREEPVTEQLLHPHKRQEGADITLQVGDVNSGEARQPPHSCLLAEQAGDPRELSVRKTTLDVGPLVETDVPYSAFGTLPHPLFDAHQMQQFYQQPHEVGLRQEDSPGLRKGLDGHSLGLQNQQQTDFGAHQQFESLAAESLHLEHQTVEVREESVRCFGAAVASAPEKAPRLDADLSSRGVGGEGNQQAVPQLQHAHASAGTVLSPARCNRPQPIHPVGRHEGVCEEEQHQLEGGISQVPPAAELPLASPTCEPASNLDNNSNTSVQSSLAMMNAVVLIERMMNALGLES